jgi:hypothetical protein
VRKRDPNAVIDQFQGELAASLSDWQATRARVGEGGPLAQRVSMDAFTRAAVAFERFRSEWHIAAIARNAAQFRAEQHNRVVLALKDAGWNELVPYLAAVMAIEVHPTLEDVAALLDAQGGNVSIRSIKHWRVLADRHLCDPWKARVYGLSWAQCKATTAVIALRNAAAHQSPQSAQKMTAALNALTHPVEHAGLRRPQRGVSVQKVPTYLNSVATGSTRRVERYHVLLGGIGTSLRVP